MSSFGGSSDNYFSYPMYKDLRDQNQVFTGMLAADRSQVGLSWHNQAENQDAEIVSGNYFQLLGLKPAAGRLIMPQDDTTKNANPVAVLSYSYWRARFGGSRDVLGQTILVNGHPFTILGVAPENFDSAIGGYRPSLFVPVSMVEQVMPWRAPLNDLTNHQSVWLTVVARLKPGVTLAQAEASLNPLWHSLRAYELTLYKSKSEHFRKNFLDLTHIKVLDDSKGFIPESRRYSKASNHPHEHGRPAGSSVCHQRRYSAAAARRSPRPRDVNAVRAWRKAQPHRFAALRRGRFARTGGCSRWSTSCSGCRSRACQNDDQL